MSTITIQGTYRQENEENIMYTMTENGLASLMTRVRDLSNKPDAQRPAGWAEAAEDAANSVTGGLNGFDDGGSPSIELRAHETQSGHTEVIDLPRDWFKQ